MFQKYWTVEIFPAAWWCPHGGGWAFCIKKGDDLIVGSGYHRRADRDALLVTALIEAIKAVKPQHHPNVRALIYVLPSMFKSVVEGPNPAIARLLVQLAKLRQRYQQFEFVTVGEERYAEFTLVAGLAYRAACFSIHMAETSLESGCVPDRPRLNFGTLNSNPSLPPALRLGKNGEPSIITK
jgi:hypothetical protein